MSGIPKMIVPYEWILENVEEEPMTIASKMILFRGEKVFRVGLKNHALNPVLFLVAINLSQIGMKVEYVTYGIQGSGTSPATMLEMTKEDTGVEGCGSLQLFTTVVDKKIVGNCTFAFRICIGGNVSGYSYRLSDRLAKDQLWAALKSQQNLTDVSKNLADVLLIVQDEENLAHKAILAARSKVFADEFKKKQPGKDGPHKIRLDGVEPSTLEKFLHFIYTGEPKGTLEDEDLLKLASKYGLDSLSDLCRVALKKIEATQMTELIESINNGVEGLDSSKVMPEKDTEIYFDRTTPTFRCYLRFHESETENRKWKCLMVYLEEDMFFAHSTGGGGGSYSNGLISKPVIHFACAKHRRFGLKVEDIYCGIPKQKPYQWFKMEEKMLKNSAELLQRFTVKLEFDTDYSYHVLNFDIKTVSTFDNYYYELMDDNWLTDFWTAATNKKWTDVEIFVGTVKVMEAHRIILSSRSPVLNESLSKISKPAEKSIVRFEAKFDVEVVKNFLNFLYTGRLESSASVHQLGKLATMYQVETLKNVCQLLNANPPDAEELTKHLLEL